MLKITFSNYAKYVSEVLVEFWEAWACSWCIVIDNTDTATTSCFKWSQKILNAIYRQNIGSETSVLEKYETALEKQKIESLTNYQYSPRPPLLFGLENQDDVNMVT